MILLSLNGGEFECNPTLLLLKHRLPLLCFTAVSAHLHLNDIHSSCIHWQEKCWDTCSPLPLFLSIPITQTTHSFKLNYIQITSQSSCLSSSLCVQQYWAEWLEEAYLPSALDFISVVWSDLVCGLLLLCFMCVSINALILLKVPLAQIKRTRLTD